MEIVVKETYDEMSRMVSDWIIDDICCRKDLLLCGAAGATPAQVYVNLKEAQNTDPELFNKIRLLKLHEWGGLSPDDPGSCENYMQKFLVKPLNISKDRYISFKSNPKDKNKECKRVRSLIGSQGPIDLCILGLGLNGHIALNEPGESLEPFSHITALSAQTLRHPMLSDAHQKPEYGLTIGMADILQSQKIFILVSGQHKNSQLRNLLNHKITTYFPASFLWLHKDVTIFCDSISAKEIDLDIQS